MQHEGTPGGGRVDVVAGVTPAAVGELLDGWRDEVGEWGSLRWLVERLGRGVPSPARPGRLSTPPEPPRFGHPAAADVA